MKKFELLATTVLLSAMVCNVNAFAASDTTTRRQADVAAKGAEVMPFTLAATKHWFGKTPKGGIQEVVARNPRDQDQIRLVREHLQEIAAKFAKGDFSAPSRIHGAAMPGLAELSGASAGAIKIVYQELPHGARIRYTATTPKLVAALHQWFDAQLGDHGHDAAEGQGGHAMQH